MEPLLRIPRTQRCRAECEMSYSRPIPTAGLPFPLRLHYPPLDPSVNLRGYLESARTINSLVAQSPPHETIQYVVANPSP